MESKRSKGVTIFGIIFIIFGLIGLLSAGCPKGSAMCSLYSRPLFALLSSGLGIVAGIFILRLKEWARILAIILRIVMIIFLVYSLFGVGKISKLFKSEVMQQQAKEVFDLKMQERLESYKPEYQEQIKQEYSKRFDAVMDKMPIFIYSILALALIWHILIIYFFTRPKVKEQFS